MLHLPVVCERQLHLAIGDNGRHVDEGEPGNILADVGRGVDRAVDTVEGLEECVCSVELLHLAEVIECDLNGPALAVLPLSLGREKPVGKVWTALASQTTPIIIDPTNGIDDVMVWIRR